MKSFLLKGKKPIIKWGQLPDNTFFEGNLPEGYSLAICPSGNEKYIILDIDQHGDINGFLNVPQNIMEELQKTLNYPTKNNGAHYWLKYTGKLPLVNKPSGLGIDLRTEKGYVVWYPKTDIRERLHEILQTSEEMDKWLVKLFTPGSKKLTI